jgi:putative Holliday junction resolvase
MGKVDPELFEIAGFPILPRSPVSAVQRGLLDSPAMVDRGPVLGVDLGEKRIGLAISDPTGSIAFPAGFVASRGRERDLAALQEVVAQRGVARIVVGLPIHLDGRPSPGSEAARRFAEALGALTGLPVDLLDERWTSRAAERSLSESKGGRKRRREAVDSVAATLLLRTYLESRVPNQATSR